MESKENKSEGGKQPNSKSSAATPDQKSKRDTKETGIEHILKSFVEDNKKFQKQLDTSIKNMAKDNKANSKKQDRMIEALDQINESLRRSSDNVLQRNADSARDQSQKEKKPIEESKGFVLSRSAFRNLAQRNISKEDNIDLSVPVKDSYHNRVKEIKSISEKRKLTY